MVMEDVSREEDDYGLNIDFETYSHHILENMDRYSGDGFNVHQLQSELEGAPKSEEVIQDLQRLEELGVIEQAEIKGTPKLSDINIYKLRTQERIPNPGKPDQEKVVPYEGDEAKVRRYGRKLEVTADDRIGTLNSMLPTIAENRFFGMDEQDVTDLLED